ncbi:hypothetical protein ACH5RR_018326 [Cinchona calisaya]|uniref:Uncharacterized protein n=1 Tax=Cinchona calisaya TaxID=153742 RepID=A0ABD2ZNZ4_9GENT
MSTCYCRNLDGTGKPLDYVDSCYKKETYLKSYEGAILPINGEIDWTQTKVIPPLPPSYGRVPRRPKKLKRRGEQNDQHEGLGADDNMEFQQEKYVNNVTEVVLTDCRIQDATAKKSKTKKATVMFALSPQSLLSFCSTNDDVIFLLQVTKKCAKQLNSKEMANKVAATSKKNETTKKLDGNNKKRTGVGSKAKVTLVDKSSTNNENGTNEASASIHNMDIFELFGLTKGQVEFLSHPGIVKRSLEPLVIQDVNLGGNSSNGNATQDLLLDIKERASCCEIADYQL